MADMMAIPKTWEQFLQMYSFEDAEQHYTNGSKLISVYRVKQMVEFYFNDVAPVVHGRWRKMDGEDVGEEWYCTECKKERHFLFEMDLQTMVDCYHYCPDCGAKMDLEEVTHD